MSWRNNYDLWHRRLCHLNIDKLFSKLSNITNHNKCQTCFNSKLKNKPFKPSKKMSSKPFDLIHMDLVVPINKSIYGNKFFLTILDDFSRYGWVLFMESKGDTFNKFYN